MQPARNEWRDRERWAGASVAPLVVMILIGAMVWPIGIPSILIGVYLILIIQKARRELRTGR